jgi:hypothetical protein
MSNISLLRTKRNKKFRLLLLSLIISPDGYFERDLSLALDAALVELESPC